MEKAFSLSETDYDRRIMLLWKNKNHEDVRDIIDNYNFFNQ